MKIYYVYILQCSDNFYYTGFTNEIERRMIEHQDGENPSCYTYKRRPVKLMHTSEFNDVNQAILFETRLKGWSRRKKEAIINGNWEILPELSKNRMKE